MIGIGLWHQQDTDALTALLDPAQGSRHTPHQITHTWQPPAGPRKGRLVRLCDSTRACGTTRVIRVYQQTGSQIELQERIDWELEAPRKGWFSEKELEKNGQP